MDAAGLTILKEMEADCAVVRDAAHKAAQRLRENAPGHLEACAYELSSLYNIVERMLEQGSLRASGRRSFQKIGFQRFGS